MDVQCADCDGQVQGQAVYVEDKIYHKQHFRCSHCHLAIKHYYHLSKEHKLPLCTSCKSLVNPICKKCKTVVQDTFIKAENQSYHLDCFVCTSCAKPFPGGEYVVHNEKPFDMDCYWSEILKANCG